MTKFKLRFGIITILVITAIVAMVIALLLPFEPNVSFSTPVLLERNDKNDFNAYDKYTIKMTNNSNYPIWCQTYNVSCFASASERFEVNSPTAPYTRLDHGQSTTINFTPLSYWDSFQISVDVFDWRNRTFSCKSEATTTQHLDK